MRLIDEAALINEAETGGWDIDLKELRMILKYVPTIDAVPVVRCKDCKHLTIVNKNPIYAVCAKTGRVFELWQEDTRQHYCSYGAKMEDKPCG